MPDFSSVIFRYRDLSTPAGTTTIEEHRSIIVAKGYVWWGWWNKQGESVPEDAFREILSEIKRSSRYEVFLFDTGRYQLRRAFLSDMVWDPRLVPIASPEREATPNYYGDSHYLAWFRLTEIQPDPLPEGNLHRWSYTRVDALFETKKSIFDAFYDKQVSSFKELRNQDRTIWFIRQKAERDGVHEIHV